MSQKAEPDRAASVGLMTCAVLCEMIAPRHLRGRRPWDSGLQIPRTLLGELLREKILSGFFLAVGNPCLGRSSIRETINLGGGW
jgi:Na+/H+-translocating membrane pyrophosphatase